MAALVPGGEWWVECSRVRVGSPKVRAMWLGAAASPNRSGLPDLQPLTGTNGTLIDEAFEPLTGHTCSWLDTGGRSSLTTVPPRSHAVAWSHRCTPSLPHGGTVPPPPHHRTSPVAERRPSSWPAFQGRVYHDISTVSRSDTRAVASWTWAIVPDFCRNPWMGVPTGWLAVAHFAGPQSSFRMSSRASVGLH